MLAPAATAEISDALGALNLDVRSLARVVAAEVYRQLGPERTADLVGRLTATALNHWDPPGPFDGAGRAVARRIAVPALQQMALGLAESIAAKSGETTS